MSKYNYDKLIATATRMIDKFGRNITKRSVSSSGDAWNPTRSNTDTIISAVATSFNANEIDGTLIKATDKLFLTYSAVTVSDLIVDGTEVLSVINVSAINPAESVLIYKVQARRT